MDDLETLDKWLVEQCIALGKVMQPYIMAGGDLSDPQYRQQLGEHQGYMRVRSFISGHKKTSTV